MPLSARLSAAAALAALSLPTHAGAASFDCGKASTRVERAICSDALLSELDEALGDVFSQVSARAAGKGIDRKGMLAMQREWQRVRDEDCGLSGRGPAATGAQVACLRKATEARIEGLLPSLDDMDENEVEDR